MCCYILDFAYPVLYLHLFKASLSLYIWTIFSYVLLCFSLCLSSSVLASFQIISTFLNSEFLPS
jgi:hypothetical protein